MKGIYFATLVLKSKVGEQEYVFKNMGPMLGTLDETKKIYMNTHDRMYYSMDSEEIFQDQIKYGYTNLAELEDFKEGSSKELSMEELVKKYYKPYDGISYYVYCKNKKDRLVIAFDPKTLKKVDNYPNSDIVKKIE